MEEGQALFITKDFERAASVFEGAYELYPYSAFLFNAGVCYERLGRSRAALAAFERYLEKDPDAPDAAQVKQRVARIRDGLQAAGGASDAPEPSLPSAQDEATDVAIQSLVVIETEPEGAPVLVYLDKSPDGSEASSFAEDSPHWELVATRTSPVHLTLAVGRYHIVVSPFREFNRSETDITVSPGHVHHFRANLSQGKFMGFLEITSNVVDATIYLDPKEDESEEARTVWGRAPHNALVTPGPHRLRLEAPGYEPRYQEVVVGAGEKQSVTVKMTRVSFGIIRVDADVREVILSVDGKVIGSWRQGESAIEHRLSSGPHQLLVQAKGYKDLRKNIDVPRGQLVPLRAKMVEKYPRGAAWTQAVLAAGFLGAGIYLGVESNRLHRELTAQRSEGYLHAGDPDIKKGFWFSVGANSAFAISAILTGSSVFQFIRDPYPDPVLYRGKNREFEEMRHREASSVRSGPRPALGTGDAHSWNGRPSSDFINRASLIYRGDALFPAHLLSPVGGTK